MLRSSPIHYMKCLFILILLMISGFRLIRQPLVKEPPASRSVIGFFQKLGYTAVSEDYLFISRFETSNAHYSEYVNWLLKHEGRQAYEQALPDSSVWKTSALFPQAYMMHYLRHPAYRDYPVLGTTCIQARNYCQWVAVRLMETEEFRKLEIDSIHVRLPSEKEWMQAARGTLSPTAIWPWPEENLRKESGRKRDRGKFMMNVSREYYDINYLSYVGYITTPVDSYWPNTLGIYNICGNAAEWVEEKRIKGGSWNHFPYDARIDTKSPYLGDSFTSAAIGFRPVIEIISHKKTISSPPLKVDAASLSKRLAKSRDSLYAAIYETSNHLYNTFLAETGNSQYKINNQGWSEHSRYFYLQEYGWHPRYDDYPVVNISYEAALAFCEWLTLKYHASDKRPFWKVKFRLPSEKEWEYAANSGRTGFYYPWNGAYTRNSRGAYLANFSPIEEMYLGGFFFMKNSKPDSGLLDYRMIRQYNYPDGDSTISRAIDGLVFTGPVNSYFPNLIGLYNCSGNVAEMIAKKGESKGGSWASGQLPIFIKSRETYIKPNACLGFRYFMEVLEQ